MSQRRKSRGIPNRQMSRLQDPVEPKNVFSRPVLNSAMHSEEEIRRITMDNLIAIDDFNLTPHTQAAVAPKINQKLNFLPDQAVFKGLVPLNVNDSILPPQKMGRKPSKGKNSKENIPKSAEPELRDYVQLVPPMTMIIPEPELRLEYKPEPFNFLEAYKKLFK